MAGKPNAKQSLAGRSFLDFDVLEELGAGGMGVVHRGLDRRLGRTVALKFLAPALEHADPDARARFLREARAASALDHPNVGRIHGIQEGPDGELCIVMAYYEGETLARRIARGPISPAEATRIGLQIAEGLAEAHAKGIVHRDVKPSNILLPTSGGVKILDFGVAKFTAGLDQTLTKPAMMLGTAAYMSPEQVRGEEADCRSDIWSFGAVLYEMLSGFPPFRATDTYSLLYAVVNEQPKPPLLNCPPIEGVVLKALEKRRVDRYQSMDELARDLQWAAAAAVEQTNAPTQHVQRQVGSIESKRKSKLTVLGGVTLLAVASLLFPAVRTQFPRLTTGATEMPARITMAILPFTSTGDASAAALADGFAEALSGRIVQLEQFREALSIVPPDDVIAKNVMNANEAKSRLGATATLSGVLSRTSGNGLRLDIELVEVNARKPIKVRLQDLKGDIRSLENRAAAEISTILHIRTDPSLVAQSGGKPRTSSQAYEAYLRGLGYMHRWDRAENLDRALAAFGEAARHDPAFARAYVGLAEASGTRFRIDKDSANFQHALNYSRQAIQLDSNLADAHVVLGRLYQESAQRDSAVAEFQRALELQPRNTAALLGMGRSYEDLGRVAEAENTYRRAVAMNPYLWSPHNALANFYFRQRRFEDAEAQFRRTLELTPDNATVYSNLGAVFTRRKKPKQAREMFERSLELAPTYQAYLNLGNVDYGEGRFAQAATYYDKALQLNSKDFRVWGTKAHALRLAGTQNAQVREAYEHAIQLAEGALRLNPRQPRTLSLLGTYYACTSDRARAMQRLEAALAQANSDPDVLLDVATGYELLDERKKAARWGQKALEQGLTLEDFQNDRDLQKLARSGAIPAPH